jgi:eukaryotic translation initiation factor 2C
MEIIKELDKMVIDLLQVFARTCGTRLPNRIVFYRDGVDDGQFQKVLDNEVNKVKEACRGKSLFIILKLFLSFLFI